MSEGEFSARAPQHPHVFDVERSGFDRNMDFTMQMRDRRSLLSYAVYDYPLALIRFSYFRSNVSLPGYISFVSGLASLVETPWRALTCSPASALEGHMRLTRFANYDPRNL